MQVFCPIFPCNNFLLSCFFLGGGKVKFCKTSRPIEYSSEQGCIIDEAEDCPNIHIGESVSFPVSIIDNSMVYSCTVHANFWAFGVCLIFILAVQNNG